MTEKNRPAGGDGEPRVLSKGKKHNLPGDITKPAQAARPRRQPDPRILAIIELLAARFPACFAVFEQRRPPLKIGIRNDILAVLDGAVTVRELRDALRYYTGNPVY